MEKEQIAELHRTIDFLKNQNQDLDKIINEKNAAYKKLKDAFYRLKSLYVAEARSNPNHVLNEASFNTDWDIKAGL